MTAPGVEMEAFWQTGEDDVERARIAGGAGQRQSGRNLAVWLWHVGA